MDLLDYQGDVKNDYIKDERVQNLINGLEDRINTKIQNLQSSRLSLRRHRLSNSQFSKLKSRLFSLSSSKLANLSRNLFKNKSRLFNPSKKHSFNPSKSQSNN